MESKDKYLLFTSIAIEIIAVGVGILISPIGGWILIAIGTPLLGYSLCKLWKVRRQSKDKQIVESEPNKLWQIYSEINNLIREMREVAPLVNKENEGKEDRLALLLFEDSRIKSILTKMEAALQVCTDSKLCDMFINLIDYEKQCALFSINPLTSHDFRLESYHQKIRDRIKKLS